MPLGSLGLMTGVGPLEADASAVADGVRVSDKRNVAVGEKPGDRVVDGVYVGVRVNDNTDAPTVSVAVGD